MTRRPFSCFFVGLLAGLLVSSALMAAAFPGNAAAQSTALQEGRTVHGTLTQGDAARYTIEVGEDFFIYGEVDQISVDVAVRILGADGDPIRQVDGGSRGGERFASQVDDAGIYTIEVTPSGDESGEFALTLHRVEPLETDPKKLTDQLMSRYDGDDSPGGAVQVWRDGRTLYSKAYGMANLAYDVPFETDTRTNIGSTSKQFTAFAVMLQADRGLLSLDDDIRKHIPELPELGETVTIRHLITHTSGLREFLNLARMSGRRLDHGDWINRSELIDLVQRQPSLQNSPGGEWNYNNTAFGFAALIVERTSGQDFHVFMRENVFGPLGMNRTLVRPSREHIVRGMSEGYMPGGESFLELGDFGGAVGAGGIYSTVEDLQIWVQNYASPRVGNQHIVDEMIASYVLTNGEETGYGYGLFVDGQGGLRRVHHGGADVSHRSMLVYYPEINAGITVQSNHGRFNSSVAFQLGAVFFADAMESEDDEAEEAEEAEVESGATWCPSASELADFTGRYFSGEIETFYTIALEDESLVVQHRRLDDATLVAGERDSFSGGRMDFSFERDRNGEVIGFYLASGRTRDVRFERVR